MVVYSLLCPSFLSFYNFVVCLFVFFFFFVNSNDDDGDDVVGVDDDVAGVLYNQAAHLYSRQWTP